MTAKKRKWNGGGKLFFLLFTDAKTSREGRREKQTNKTKQRTNDKEQSRQSEGKRVGFSVCLPF